VIEQMKELVHNIHISNSKPALVLDSDIPQMQMFVFSHALYVTCLLATGSLDLQHISPPAEVPNSSQSVLDDGLTIPKACSSFTKSVEDP